MKQTFIKKEGNPRLMLFFAGWGSEENLFRRPVEEGYDYLLCFDYRTLDFDYASIKGYTEIRLLAWSMGVWAFLSVANETGCQRDAFPDRRPAGNPRNDFQRHIGAFLGRHVSTFPPQDVRLFRTNGRIPVPCPHPYGGRAPRRTGRTGTGNNHTCSPFLHLGQSHHRKPGQNISATQPTQGMARNRNHGNRSRTLRYTAVQPSA